jgi:drug/metabolite transporter (DMT)-like permease
MGSLALILTLASALLHALFNFLIKRSDDKLTFSWLLRIVGQILLLPAVLSRPLRPIPPIGWGLILASGFVHAGYAYSLARAYDGGDLSLVYPIARSAPVLVLLWATVIWREPISGIGVAGILLIAFGAFIVQVRGFSLRELWEPVRASLRDPALRMAWMTAILVAAYSLIDDRGVVAVDPVVFLFAFGATGCLILSPFVLIRRRRRLAPRGWPDWRHVLLAGAIGTGGYLLALFALRVGHVGYVASVRQLSILFGVIMGWRLLSEPHGAIRLSGAGFMVAGLLLIGLGT